MELQELIEDMCSEEESNVEEILQKLGNPVEFAKGDLLRIWGSGTFNNIILAFICGISLIEIGVAVYKTLKYAKKSPHP